MRTSLHSRSFALMLVSAGLACVGACGTENGVPGGGGTPSVPGAGGQSTSATGGAVASTGGATASGSGGMSAGMSPGGSAAGGSSSSSSAGNPGSGGVIAGGASSGGKSSAGSSSGGSGGKSSMPNSGGSSSGGKAAGGSSSGGSSAAGAAGSGGAAPGTRSAGCGKTTTLMNGRASIDVSGTAREYILALPTGYDPSRAYRLIFGWHPLGGSAQQVASGGYYGLKTLAGDQAIFVAPEGLPFSGSNLGWGNDNGRDLAFLQAMLDRFRGELCIDEGRIFSTGFSFGGMMSFAVGCSSMSMMRAIAPMAGNSMVSGCQSGDRPVALMGFHGVDDTVVLISGGRTARDVFVKRNGCSSETMPVEPSWCGGLKDNYKPCSCVSYQGCKEGYPVIWCEYKAGHMAAPSSGATLWEFFSQF
ncbi:MAG TPA: Ricin and poly(3-hydroxybutyrate) depolymerase fusion [Polyangiaceae bacterium]|nr:Ricin and poly(3-hydroxybutyrate) depolymerase fusion [Polyangiaceae bacterium]